MYGQNHTDDEPQATGNDGPTGNGPPEHGHSHGAIDRAVLGSSRGIWATKVSLVGLLATASMQVVVVVFTGSVALLADTIHNFGDASTALPLMGGVYPGPAQAHPPVHLRTGAGRRPGGAGCCRSHTGLRGPCGVHVHQPVVRPAGN